MNKNRKIKVDHNIPITIRYTGGDEREIMASQLTIRDSRGKVVAKGR